VELASIGVSLVEAEAEFEVADPICTSSSTRVQEYVGASPVRRDKKHEAA
jgi:hypothetical protein